MRPLYFTKSLDFKACFQPNSTIYSIYSFVESNFFLTCFNLISKPYYTFAKHVPSKQKITIQDPPGKRRSQGDGFTLYLFGWWFSNPSSHLLNTPCPAAIPWPYSRKKLGLSAGTVITKESKKPKTEFSWGLYCLVVLFLLLNIICASVPTKRTQNPKILLNCCYWLSQMSVFYTLAHVKHVNNRNLCHYIVIIPTNLRSQHE